MSFRADGRTRRRAFSVLEIMVAVALLAVIIVGLLAMFYQVQRAFRAGTAQVDVMEGGRATMNLITRDLQEMTATGLSFVTNCVILPAEALTITTQELPSGEARENYLQDICFMSRRNDEWIGTAYRVAFADTGVGTLYRLVTNRFRETLPLTNAIVISNLSFTASTATPDNSLNFHRVLDGVVHFTFTPYDTNGISFRTYPDTNPREGLRDLRIDLNNADILAFMETNLPAYIDIELAVLEPSAFEKFKARVDSGPPQSITRATNYLARQIGRTHVFRQRVAIRPAATDIGARFGLASP